MRNWFNIACIVFLPVIFTGCRKDKSAFENQELYEYHAPWYWKNSYKKVVVPVAIGNRVPAEFFTVKSYYKKVGQKDYEPVEVKVVNLRQWRVVEERRKNMLNNMFYFFMIIAAAGFVAVIAGLFCAYQGIALWDELLVGGGLASSFGLTSAWYVDYLPLICTVFSVGTVAMAVYILVRRRMNHNKHQGAIKETATALEETVGTLEKLKGEARGAWNTLKDQGEIIQSETTESLVSKIKEQLT